MIIVLRNVSDCYYAPQRLHPFDFLVDHTLTLEQSGSKAIIRDSFEDEFKTLAWYDILDLTWKGQALFDVAKTTTTIRPRGQLHREETKVATF